MSDSEDTAVEPLGSEAPRRQRPASFPSWLSWAAASIAGGAVVAVVVAAVLWPLDVPRAAVPHILTLGRPMPPQPYPGQRRPPCTPQIERAINGACWLGPFEGLKSPCGDRLFDYEGKCYVAAYPPERQPASEEP